MRRSGKFFIRPWHVLTLGAACLSAVAAEAVLPWEKIKDTDVLWVRVNNTAIDFPSRYEPNEPLSPIARIALLCMEKGTEEGNFPAYALLKEPIKRELERLGVVAGGQCTCRLSVSFTLHQPCRDRNHAIWRIFDPTKRKGVNFRGPAAVKFLTLSTSGQIAFESSVDQGEDVSTAVRVASFPNGFLLRQFPCDVREGNLSEETANAPYWRTTIRGADPDQAFCFAVLVIAPEKVAVCIEVLPPGRFAGVDPASEADHIRMERVFNDAYDREFTDRLAALLPPAGEAREVPDKKLPAPEVTEAPPPPPGKKSAGPPPGSSPEVSSSAKESPGEEDERHHPDEMANACFEAASCGNFPAIRDIFEASPEKILAILTAVSQSLWPKETTLLHGAAAGGHYRMVQLLLEKLTFGDEMNAKILNAKAQGRTPLCLAIERGHTEIARLLLEQKDIKINTIDAYGETALHIAAQKGRDEIVKILLEKHASVSSENSTKRTPLHEAAFCGRTEVVRKLLKNGARVDAKDEQGCTALHLAAIGGHTEVTRALVDSVRPEAKKAMIEARSERQWTPLHRAARNGHTACVDFLLKNDADVGAQTQKGETALHLALMSGDTLGRRYNGAEVCDILLSRLRQEGVNILEMLRNETFLRATYEYANKDESVFKRWKEKVLEAPYGERTRKWYTDLLKCYGVDTDALLVDPPAP